MVPSCTMLNDNHILEAMVLAGRVKEPSSEGVLIAQWLEYPTRTTEVVSLISPCSSEMFSVLHLFPSKYCEQFY